jgi:hypothetical protein
MNNNNFIKKNAKPSYKKNIQENRGSIYFYNLENKSGLPNFLRKN